MSEHDPWYRHTWPWVLITIPFTAVVFGILMIVTANWHPNDVVVDDYYKKGMAINERLEKEDHAAQRRIRAESLKLSASRIELQIENVDNMPVVMNLYHVTDSSRDRRLVLVPEGAGRFAASTDEDLPFESEGVWYVELEDVDATWRVRSRVQTPVARLEISAG